jgi:hypothetical protein
MRNIAFLVSILFIISCSSYENKVRIQFDKKIVLVGDDITARLYVDHDNSVAPDFNILRNQDTAHLPIDLSDNQCGVYKALASKPGKKEIIGFVNLLDKQNKRQTYHFTFKYTVTEKN